MTTPNLVEANISPYKLATVLTEAVQKAGFDRIIPPQYLYSMTRGDDPRLSTHLSETGKQTITPKTANKFIEDFIVRLQEKAKKAAEAEVEVEASSATK